MLEDQCTDTPRKAPILGAAEAKNIRLSTSTISSMATLAIKVLMAIRDLQCPAIVCNAHLTRPISFPLSPIPFFLVQIRFLKTGEFRPGISTLQHGLLTLSR